MELKIRVKCSKCQGDGVAESPIETGILVTDPCNVCGGTGYSTPFYLDVSDIADKLNDILDKCNDIFEKVSEKKLR